MKKKYLALGVLIVFAAASGPTIYGHLVNKKGKELTAKDREITQMVTSKLEVVKKDFDTDDTLSSEVIQLEIGESQEYYLTKDGINYLRCVKRIAVDGLRSRRDKIVYCVVDTDELITNHEEYTVFSYQEYKTIFPEKTLKLTIYE